MPTNPARRPRLAIILAAGLILAFAFSFSRVERVLVRTSATVISGGWGAGAGEFGLGRGGDGRTFGPHSFALDGQGQIYVVDTYNQAVIKFDPDGRPLLRFKVGDGLGWEPFLDDLAVADDGSIFLADNTRGLVLKYSPDGAFQATIKVAVDGEKASLRRVEALAPAPAGGVYVLVVSLTEGGYRGSIKRWSGRGTVLATPIDVILDPIGRPTNGSNGKVRAPIEGFAQVGKDRVVVMTAGQTPFQRLFYYLAEDGRAVRSLLYESSNFIERAALLGADGAGCLYVGIDLSMPEGRVVKLAPDGQVQEVIDPAVESPAASDPETMLLGRVDERGNVYLTRALGTGFSVIRVAQSHRLTLRTPFTAGRDRGAGED